jgi:hypothetical protein
VALLPQTFENYCAARGAAALNLSQAFTMGLPSGPETSWGAGVARVNGSPAAGVAAAASASQARTMGESSGWPCVAPGVAGAWLVVGGVEFRPGFRRQASWKARGREPHSAKSASVASQSAAQSCSLYSVCMIRSFLRQLPHVHLNAAGVLRARRLKRAGIRPARRLPPAGPIDAGAMTPAKGGAPSCRQNR